MKNALMPCLPFALALACAIATPAGVARTTPALSSGASTTVSPADRAAADAWWKHLGITPPKGGYVLEHPWSKPWSGRSLVVPATWFGQAYDHARQHVKNRTPLPVDAAALRADLPTLHMALEKNYSGWESAKKKGWNWNRWFKQWDAMLAGYGERTIPDDKAFAPWFAYEQFQIDGHSGPEIPTRFGQNVHSVSALLASRPHGSCTRLETTDGKWHALDAKDPAQQPHAVKQWNGEALQPAAYVVYPSSFGTAKSAVCGGQTIAATPFWNPYSGSPRQPLAQSVAAFSDGRKGLAIYNTVAPGIGYLRLAAFSDAGDEALTKLLPTLPASAGHEKLLIVDLRGNDGGNAPLEQLSRWIPVKQIAGQPTQVGKRSCLYPGLWFNLGQVLALGVKPPVSADFHRVMTAYARGLDAPSSTNCPVSFETTHGTWHYTEHHFARHWQGKRPRLLVLVDDRCASDCEYMTWMLAQLPGTVIAGSNTFGVTGFTQPGFLLLPHTRIAFQLATSRTDDYGDGRSENGYGLDVDVVLPNRSDWSAESITGLARSLAAGQPHRAH